jgi:hypothetical protein
MVGIPSVDNLGNLLEASWGRAGYSPTAFPGLCEAALREAGLPAQIAPDDIVIWSLRAPVLPLQADPPARFGQPPVTLFRGSRFYIDALFWIDGTTAIHQHGFSGAFQVLAGSGIETRFVFEEERTFDGHFLFGTLQAASSTLLRVGDIRPIASGGALIHSLFHLERPSVSLVIRTIADPGFSPQFSYARAGIAHNPFFTNEAADRKRQLLAMLRSIRHQDFEKIAADSVSDADLHSAYRIIQDFSDYGLIDRLIDRVRDEDAAFRFRSFLKDQRREALLKSRRNVVSDPELRFFLGVLLNATSLRDVFTLTRAKSADIEPARQVAAWLRQLSSVTLKLQAEGLPWQPNILGLPDFDDEIERACVGLLKGEDLEPSEKAAQSIAQLRALPALACLFNG